MISCVEHEKMFKASGQSSSFGFLMVSSKFGQTFKTVEIHMRRLRMSRLIRNFTVSLIFSFQQLKYEKNKVTLRIYLMFKVTWLTLMYSAYQALFFCSNSVNIIHSKKVKYHAALFLQASFLINIDKLYV